MPHSRSHPSPSRIIAVNIGVLVCVAAIVVIVSDLLPVIPALVYPLVFTIVTAVLLALAVAASRRGALAASHIWAGWAGFLIVLLVLAWSNLFGWGGALSTTLLVAIVLNTVVAGAFRSGVHLAVVQLGSLIWAAIAFLYGIPPLPLIVLAAIGLWWLGAVGYSASVVIATALILPVGATLLVHPLTHDALAVDGGDIATLAGMVALASLLGSIITRRVPDPRIWGVMRPTIVIVLIAQAALGSIPAVAEIFRPEDPWPGLLTGLCALSIAAAVLVFRRHRAGAWAVIGYGGLLWASVAAQVLLPAPIPALLTPAVLFVLLSRMMWRTAPFSRKTAHLALAMALDDVALVLLAAPTPGGAAVMLAVCGLTIIALVLRMQPVPPRGRTEAVPDLPEDDRPPRDGTPIAVDEAVTR